MFIRRMVTHCDVTQTSYKTPVSGMAGIARGATGRWCEVMWFGPEYIKKHGLKATPYNEAVKYVESLGDEVDF